MSAVRMLTRSTRPLALHRWADVPRAPGCYCVWSKCGTALYVGKASDLKARLKSRADDGWWLTGVSCSQRRFMREKPRQAPPGALLSTWLVALPENTKRLELLLIGLLEPAYNIRPTWDSPSVQQVLQEQRRLSLRVLQGGTP